MKKVVLAYSGGLDTTYCAVYLSKIKGYKVHAVTVNTGAFTDEDIEKRTSFASKIGAITDPAKQLKIGK